jgi:hypothetical protein
MNAGVSLTVDRVVARPVVLKLPIGLREGSARRGFRSCSAIHALRRQRR